MHITPDGQWIDDIRQRIQKALNESKRDVLRDRYGMVAEYRSPDMPPELESDWLDYITEFERQFENAELILVRDRIGNPPIPSIDDLNESEIVTVVDALMELLEAHFIRVEVLGDATYESVYRYLVEEVLEEEIEDIRIPEMWLNFTYTTEEYDAGFWIEEFVGSVCRQNLEYVMYCLEDNCLPSNMAGTPVTLGDLESLWARMPLVQFPKVEVLAAQIEGDDGRLTAQVTLPTNAGTQSVEVEFVVHRSSYVDEAWDIRQTSLLDELGRLY